MGRENVEPNQEIPTENGETNGEEAGAAEEPGTEEKVVPEIPAEEAPGVDPELFEGVPEAPLGEEDEE